MKLIAKSIYRTLAEVEARIADLESSALLLSPESDEHRNMMKESARLRLYAETKRWMISPIPRPIHARTQD